MGKLVIYLVDGATREVYLTKERMTIGRRPDNDVPLPFAAVSGEHAAVITVLSDSFLEDLGSTNGTLVNGKSITKHFLRDRDHIDIGRENLVYYEQDSALPDPLAPKLLKSDATSPSPHSTRSARVEDFERRSGIITTEFDSVDHNETTERTSPFRFVISDPDAASLSGADAPSTAQSIDTERVDAAAFAIKVMTGPSAGRELALGEEEITLGRVGMCVAKVRCRGDKVMLIAVEGPEAPILNGAIVTSEPVSLSVSSTFIVAGTELVLLRR